MKKSWIAGINFERMILAFGIIAYHFYISSASETKLFLNINSLDFGTIITTCFFILSGALLFYNHETVDDLKKFYIKRFKVIFPAFWIGYVFMYIVMAISNHAFFWSSAPKWRLLLSVCGVDGYMHEYLNGQDFYILGEWFLGAIIILYLLYPLLSWLMRKSFVITTIIVYGLYVAYLLSDQSFWFKIIIYIAYFYTGMVMFKFKKYLFDSKTSLVISIAVCLVFAIFETGRFSVFYLLFGAGIFIILQRVGSLVEKWKPAGKVCKFVGGVSYEIFLVQHIIILKVLSFINPTDTFRSIVLLIVTILICILCAKILNFVAGKIISLFSKKKQSTKLN